MGQHTQAGGELAKSRGGGAQQVLATTELWPYAFPTFVPESIMMPFTEKGKTNKKNKVKIFKKKIFILCQNKLQLISVELEKEVNLINSDLEQPRQQNGHSNQSKFHTCIFSHNPHSMFCSGNHDYSPFPNEKTEILEILVTRPKS